IYPKKANKGLIKIDDYKFSLVDDYLNKLKEEYDFSRVGFSFLVWLNRFNTFDSVEREPGALFDKLVENVRREYPEGLADLIAFSNRDDFVDYSRSLNSLLSESEVQLNMLFELRPQVNQDTRHRFNSTSIFILCKPFLL